MSWQSLSIGDVFEFVRNGKNIKQSKEPDGLPVTRIETISDGRVDSARVGYAGLRETGNEQWLLQPGDILFSHINSVEHVGKCAIYEGVPAKLVHGMNLLALRVKQDCLHSKYALYALRTRHFRLDLLQFVNKAVNQASVSTTNLKSLKIPVPPLAEQRRIAAILDQADDLRRKRREALELLASLAQAIYVEMFQSTPAGEFPLKELRQLGTVVTGSTPPSSLEGMFGGPTPFVTPGDLERDKPAKRTLTAEGAKASRLVPEGSALVCCIGATIGKMSIADQTCAFNQQINAVDWSEQIDGNFGIFALQSRRAKIIGNATSTTLPILKKSLFERISIPVPPLSRQRAFAARVAEIDKLKVHHRAHLAKLDSLFAALQDRAFRGELTGAALKKEIA